MALALLVKIMLANYLSSLFFLSFYFGRMQVFLLGCRGHHLYG